MTGPGPDGAVERVLGATYQPGRWLALMGPRCVLLLAATDDELIERCWPLVQADAGIGALVEALTRDGLTRTGDFALVRLGPGAGPDTAVVRGSANVETATLAGVPSAITAKAVSTWVETQVNAEGCRISFGSLPDDAPAGGYPLAGGVVRAESIELTWSSADTTGPAPSDGGEVRAAAFSAGSAEPTDERQSRAPTTGPIDPAQDFPVPDFDSIGPTQHFTLGGPAPTPPEPPASAEPDTASDGEVALDDVVATEAEPGPEFADEDSVAPSSEFDLDPATARTRALDVSNTETRAVDVSATGTRAIDEGATPTVSVVICPYGHLSPPAGPICRVCGTPIAAQEPHPAPRPVLGLLRLSTGDVVTLDRGVVLGRNPQQSVSAADPARPHMVPVPSPNKDISRAHVEVRIVDWNVVVTDLGSTNGTTISAPGHAPLRLRPHEPVAIEPNTEVNMADEVVFRYEVTA